MGNMRFKVDRGILSGAILLAVFSALTVSGLLSTQRVLSSSGSVKAINVEVYWDLACTQVVSSIDWGVPEPGDSVLKTVYVKNTGTAPMTLNMSCSGWSPAQAENYLTVSWDRDEAVVNGGSVLQAVLTLSVSDTITGITDFSFDIVIAGTG